jgi:hypothetical protein
MPERRRFPLSGRRISFFVEAFTLQLGSTDLQLILFL